MKKYYDRAGAFIVCCWVAAMASLVMKETSAFRPVQLEKQYISTAIESRQAWLGIYLKNSKIGYSSSEIRRIEQGYQITEDVFMDLTVMGMPQKIQTRVSAIADSGLRLQIFSFRLFSGIMSMSVAGTVRERNLRLQIQTAGRTDWRTIPLKELPVLTENLRYYILQQGIKPGMKYSCPFFDPLTLGISTLQVQVQDKEQIRIHDQTHECYKIQTFFQGMTVSAWVNEQGETLREESPMGLVMLRESKSQALEQGWGERPDITAVTAIKVDKSFSAADLSYMKLRLADVALDGFQLNTGRQRLTGSELEIRREQLPAETEAFDFTGSGLEPFLQSSAFIQCDDPGIRQSVQEILKGEKRTALASVRLLNSWVYGNIMKKPTLSIPSAVAVLASKQGDCNEHAVLLTAFCRAAGIPARVAAGIVHLSGSFFYHAWCEVFLGSWISVDPAMNQLPADVSHIKFVDGDMENQIILMRLIGKLQIKVLEYL